jgi:hypothetical protein
MKLKNMVLTALLMAIGLVLHQIVPPIVGGMKPDFLLAMLFIALFIDDSPKNALVAGLLAGIFSALTTGFPGGQMANLCDKLVTSFAVVALIKATAGFSKHFSVPLVACLGTMISGTVFLATALVVVGSLPVAFSVLFVTVVLPATLVNAVTTYIVYNMVFSTAKSLKIV